MKRTAAALVLLAVSALASAYGQQVAGPAAPQDASRAAFQADSYAAFQANSYAASQANSHAAYQANSHAVSQADSHAASQADSHAAFQADSQAALQAKSHAASQADSQGALQVNSQAAFQADSQPNSHATSQARSPAAAKARSRPAAQANPQATSQNASQGAAQEDLLLKVQVQIVNVPAIVQTANGRPVQGLKLEDFTLTDNNQPQKIHHLWSEELPLTIGLVLDVSESQLKVLEQNRQVMRDFLRGLLRPQDRVFLVAFTGQARLFHDFTASGDAVMDAAAKIHTADQVDGKPLGPRCKPLPPPRGQRTLKKPPKTCGGSALWHAMYWTLEKLKNDAAEGRKALVLVTDGQDSGSDRSLDQVVAAAQKHSVIVYAVGVGGKTGKPEAALNAADLRRLGEQSGGALFTEEQNARAIFERINRDLRSQYILGFSPDTGCDGQFHGLTVTAGPGRVVRTRPGYQADCP